MNVIYLNLLKPPAFPPTFPPPQPMKKLSSRKLVPKVKMVGSAGL